MFSCLRFISYVLETLKVVFEPVTSSSFHVRKINVKFMLQIQQFSHWRSVKLGEIDGCLKKQWTWEYISKMLLIEGLRVKVLCCKVAKTCIKNGIFDASLAHGLKMPMQKTGFEWLKPLAQRAPALISELSKGHIINYGRGGSNMHSFKFLF